MVARTRSLFPCGHVRLRLLAHNRVIELACIGTHDHTPNAHDYATVVRLPAVAVVAVGGGVL